ncbi:hypothetical protein TSAR_009196 [Trichomalopsis sarcophagae]|uniref:Uncharacterized protein n=1 Tax=Trichomalopsis sarcophagae TaxID=543379 RepID=A0A232FFD5_9HYME|nr:hypothetical protein TSAR_009196 [Trichomalopsis sarcophagae]
MQTFKQLQDHGQSRDNQQHSQLRYLLQLSTPVLQSMINSNCIPTEHRVTTKRGQQEQQEHQLRHQLPLMPIAELCRSNDKGKRQKTQKQHQQSGEREREQPCPFSSMDMVEVPKYHNDSENSPREPVQQPNLQDQSRMVKFKKAGKATKKKTAIRKKLVEDQEQWLRQATQRRILQPLLITDILASMPPLPPEKDVTPGIIPILLKKSKECR